MQETTKGLESPRIARVAEAVPTLLPRAGHLLAYGGLRIGEATGLRVDRLDLVRPQARGGHSTIAVTMDTYGHLFPAQDEALAERLDAMLGGIWSIYGRRPHATL
jgi:integrase